MKKDQFNSMLEKVESSFKPYTTPPSFLRSVIQLLFQTVTGKSPYKLLGNAVIRPTTPHYTRWSRRGIGDR